MYAAICQYPYLIMSSVWGDGGMQKRDTENIHII